MTQADLSHSNLLGANDDASGSALSPLQTFAGIWACATLVHLLSFPFWARTWQGWVIVLAVGLTLAQPRSLPRFTFMIVASLTNLFRQMPFVPNHILFEGIINLTILISIVWICWKSREKLPLTRLLRSAIETHRISLVLALGYLLLMVYTQHESVGGVATVLMVLVLDKRFSQPSETPALSTDIYRHFSPIVRVQVVLMYFWAVTQKLNWDYLNPVVSAATKLQREIADRVPILPTMEWTFPFGIWGSLLFEAGIPILLLFRRTRFPGFIAAVCFHLLLAIHPHPGIFSYSALIFGVLVLFLPEPARLKLHEEWDRQRAALSRKLHVIVTPHQMATFAFTVFYIAITIFGIVYRLRGETRENFDLNCLMASYVWFAWGIWMGYCYIRAMFLSRGESRALSSRLTWSPALIGILLVMCNGISPWVGLKTQTSFSMFSNLRTEFAPNHLFLKRIDLFDYQREMVEVLKSDTDTNIFDPKKMPIGIEQRANSDARILPAFELRRLLSRWDKEADVRIQIRHGSKGKVEVIERVGGQSSHPELFEPINLFQFKFLWFRRHVKWNGPMPSTH